MERDSSPERLEIGQKPRKILRLDINDDDSGVSASGSDVDSQSSRDSRPIPIENVNNEENSKDPGLKEVESKAEQLAEFIIDRLRADNDSNYTPDEVDATMLRCVNTMRSKHEMLFKGMMKRLSINDETAYTAFLTVANELFEGEQAVVNWGKIVALYAFGGQLGIYCKEKNLSECGRRIPVYVGRYAKEVISKFIYEKGGWKKLCEEFPPEDDLDSKVWKFLTWTAVGLGLATAASFFASHT